MFGEMVLFTGNANPELARGIGRSLGQPLAPAQTGRFSDGETRVELKANVRGRDVFLEHRAVACAPRGRVAEGSAPATPVGVGVLVAPHVNRDSDTAATHARPPPRLQKGQE